MACYWGILLVVSIVAAASDPKTCGWHGCSSAQAQGAAEGGWSQIQSVSHILRASKSQVLVRDDSADVVAEVTVRDVSNQSRINLMDLSEQRAWLAMAEVAALQKRGRHLEQSTRSLNQSWSLSHRELRDIENDATVSKGLCKSQLHNAQDQMGKLMADVASLTSQVQTTSKEVSVMQKELKATFGDIKSADAVDKETGRQKRRCRRDKILNQRMVRSLKRDVMIVKHLSVGKVVARYHHQHRIKVRYWRESRTRKRRRKRSGEFRFSRHSVKTKNQSMGKTQRHKWRGQRRKRRRFLSRTCRRFRRWLICNTIEHAVRSARWRRRRHQSTKGKGRRQRKRRRGYQKRRMKRRRQRSGRMSRRGMRRRGRRKKWRGRGRHTKGRRKRQKRRGKGGHTKGKRKRQKRRGKRSHTKGKGKRRRRRKKKRRRKKSNLKKKQGKIKGIGPEFDACNGKSVGETCQYFVPRPHVQVTLLQGEDVGSPRFRGTCRHSPQKKLKCTLAAANSTSRGKEFRGAAFDACADKSLGDTCNYFAVVVPQVGLIQDHAGTSPAPRPVQGICRGRQGRLKCKHKRPVKPTLRLMMSSSASRALPLRLNLLRTFGSPDMAKDVSFARKSVKATFKAASELGSCMYPASANITLLERFMSTGKPRRSKGGRKHVRKTKKVRKVVTKKGGRKHVKKVKTVRKVVTKKGGRKRKVVTKIVKKITKRKKHAGRQRRTRRKGKKNSRKRKRRKGTKKNRRKGKSKSKKHKRKGKRRKGEKKRRSRKRRKAKKKQRKRRKGKKKQRKRRKGKRKRKRRKRKRRKKRRRRKRRKGKKKQRKRRKGKKKQRKRRKGKKKQRKRRKGKRKRKRRKRRKHRKKRRRRKRRKHKKKRKRRKRRKGKKKQRKRRKGKKKQRKRRKGKRKRKRRKHKRKKQKRRRRKRRKRKKKRRRRKRRKGKKKRRRRKRRTSKKKRRRRKRRKKKKRRRRKRRKKRRRQKRRKGKKRRRRKRRKGKKKRRRRKGKKKRRRRKGKKKRRRRRRKTRKGKKKNNRKRRRKKRRRKVRVPGSCQHLKRYLVKQYKTSSLRMQKLMRSYKKSGQSRACLAAAEAHRQRFMVVQERTDKLSAEIQTRMGKLVQLRPALASVRRARKLIRVEIKGLRSECKELPKTERTLKVTGIVIKHLSHCPGLQGQRRTL